MDRSDSLQRAKIRVDEIRGFYIHALVYLSVNLLIIGYSILEALSDGEAWANAETFKLAFFWGIGLGIHAMSVFGIHLLMGKDWEQRQIHKFMKEDRKEAEKYN